jgi:hypothetical protein
MSIKICPNSLKERMQRASNGKSKAQIELARRIEKIAREDKKGMVRISIIYKSKAKKI